MTTETAVEKPAGVPTEVGMLSAMTFTDLPSDWPSRSLADRALAPDVVDLVVRDGDRAAGSMTLLLCDDDGRMIQPVTVGDVPDSCSEEERRAFFDAFLDHLGHALGGVVVAIGRPSGRWPSDSDRDWHESAITACRATGVQLLGTYLATADGVTELPCWVEDLAG